MSKEKWYINESELDDYQMQIIRRNLSSSFIVKGCAGSGKTVLALWRAKEIAESGEGSYLVIVYTRTLNKFINDGINEIGVDESKVMYHWEWKNQGMPKADFIIIDEVQDFDEEELKELKSSAQKHFILFGDSAQQLYKNLPKKGNLLSMEGIQMLTRIPMENLVINHRLPKKIARIAEKVTNSIDPLEERCKKEGVNKARLIKCANLHDELNYIMQVVKAQNYTDVGILFPTNKDVDNAYSYFKDKSWGVEKKAGFGASAMDIDFTTDNPKLMTYHSAKGLQFEAVFLPNCTVSGEKHRNPLYVALTRSYRDLFILYSDNLSSYINEIDDSLFELHDNTGFIEDDDLPF